MFPCVTLTDTHSAVQSNPCTHTHTHTPHDLIQSTNHQGAEAAGRQSPSPLSDSAGCLSVTLENRVNCRSRGFSRAAETETEKCLLHLCNKLRRRRIISDAVMRLVSLLYFTCTSKVT